MRWEALTKVVAAGLAAALLGAGCGGDALSRPKDAEAGAGGPVKIGFLAPLSGVYTALGEDLKQGFDFFMEEHEGRLGGWDVEVVVADEGNGPDTGVPAARRLLTRDRVVAVAGVVNSAVALGVRDLFAETEVPLIVTNAGANDITGKAGSPFLWRTSFANADANVVYGRWLAKQAKVKGGVFVMGADYAAGREQIAGFKEAFTAAGGRIAGEAYTPFGQTQDFQPFLTQIRQSGAGAVHVFYAGAEAVTFVRQYAEFGLAGKLPLSSAGHLTEGAVLKAQGGAALGIRTAFHYSSEIDTEVNREFAAAYRERFDEAPTSFAVQAYDTARILDLVLSGMKGSVSGARIVAALATVGTVDSPRGPWHFGPDRNPVQPYYLREVRKVGGELANVVVEDLGVYDPAEQS